MEVTNQPTSNNDYAVARELNLLVMGMIMNIYLADYTGATKDLDIQGINRAYILLVDELKKLYDNNPKLSAIEPEPIWKRFDVLKASAREIKKHLSDPDNDYGSAHYARVERLCILANAETPHFTEKQKKVKDYAKNMLDNYYEGVEEAISQYAAKESGDTLGTQENGGQIAKLSLVQKTLKLNANGVTLTLKRFDSKKRFNYNLAKFLLDRPDEWIKKEDLGTNFKTIRSQVKDWPKLLGFTGELKDIFLSVNTKEQTIMLNPSKSLTSEEAEILKRLVNTSKPK